MPRTTTHDVSVLNERMREAGFVHVTGLPYYNELQGYDGEIQPSRRHLGKWDHNNGVTVVVTEEGEVWLGQGIPLDKDLLEEVAPNGKGAQVPCSNGEEIPMKFLMGRFRNSYIGFDGRFRPKPQPE